ncbi:MAG: hypothetical protein HOP31_08820 [Ignavibacteria bacterium]|nr:hypothetical protein [Ignavibacteria bacterium]
MRKPLGLNPTGISKKFVISVLILFTIFFIIGIIAGCGDDNITNNNNNNGNTENLIFSKDSIAVNGSGHQFVLFIDTLAIDTGILKTTFDVETNCDSLLDNPWIYVTAFVPNDTITYLQKSLPIRNGSYTFSSNVTISQPVEFDFRLEYNSTTPKFMRFKNIKIYN